MIPSNNQENKSPSGTYRTAQVVCEKVQAHSFSEAPLEYNQDQMPLTVINQGLL